MKTETQTKTRLKKALRDLLIAIDDFQKVGATPWGTAAIKRARALAK